MATNNKTSILNVIKWIALFSALIIIMMGAVILGMRIYYNSFYESATQEFKLDALEANFVPQGLDYIESCNAFLISGYIGENEHAKISVIEPQGEQRMLSVLDEEGATLSSHSGGISHNEKFVYLAGCDGKCYVFSLEDLMKERATSIRAIGSFFTYNQSAFCSIMGEYLFVGEYYYWIKYNTDETHHLVTPSGEENRAIMTVFRIDDSLPLGVYEKPEMALSITGRIQGMCFLDDNTLVMSASSVFEGSQLYVYDYEVALAGNYEIILLDGNEIPLYYLDSRKVLNCIDILPKSEGVAVCGDRLFMIFESASNKFKFGKLLGCEFAYSIPIELLEKRRKMED